MSCPIEQALRNAGSKVEGEGYSVAYAVAEDNLRLGRIVVADCINPWPLTRDEWRSAADRAGVRTVDVEVVCSDVDEHRRRVESRSTDLPGHRLPTWTEVVERDYRPWSCKRLVIDTALLDLEETFEGFCRWPHRQVTTREEAIRSAANDWSSAAHRVFQEPGR